MTEAQYLHASLAGLSDVVRMKDKKEVNGTEQVANLISTDYSSR